MRAGIVDVPMTNLILVGMAGVMSGVLYAPLTAIFLIAESSSGYDLFIPLMIVAVISFLMAKWFSPTSPEMEKLVKEGQIFTREHDKNLLSLLHTSDLVDEQSQVIIEDASIHDLRQILKNGRRNLIAVLNDNSIMTGIINLDDIRPILFGDDLDKSSGIKRLVKPVGRFVIESDSVVDVAKKFDETGLWNLPVIKTSGEFAGFISKSSVLDRYRKLLQEHSG